ncbi:MAG: PAS domain-containing protein, partial [Desulfovibrio sp.]|nr:PAS domain-containing protein [Desulfovibrio sp.]
MTTKYRIILGFVVMVVLLGGMAALGYSSLRTTVTQFVEYKRLSDMNAAASDMEAGMSASVYYLMAILDDRDDKALADFRKNVQRASENAKRCLDLTLERKAIFSDILKSIEAYKKLGEDMVSSYMSGWNNFVNVVRPSLVKLQDSLDKVRELTHVNNNFQVLDTLADALVHVSASRASIGLFSMSRDEVDAKESLNSLNKAAEIVYRLDQDMTTDAGKATAAVAKKAMAESLEIFKKMATLYKTANDNVDKAQSISRDLRHTAQQVSEDSEKRCSAYGRDLTQSSASAQTFLLSMGIGGLALGVLLAVFIIIGIMHILVKVSAFATAVSGGDVEARCEVKEKGEIGVMVEAIKAIPETMKGMRDGFLALAGKIQHGDIAARGRLELYKNGFAEIVGACNASLAALLSVIEEMPNPVVVLNADSRAEYLNARGRSYVGNDYKGKLCKELINREDDGTAGDALRKAYSTKQRASGETVAHPGGKTIDVMYTAIPMLDEQQKLLACMQFITDISSIKSQQRTMLEVAKNAGEISDRVAAASEQLAAQVEQV